MKLAVYPGTFDPITNGHVDIIKRASLLFDKMIVVVAENTTKTPLFNAEERSEMVRGSLVGIEGVEVENFDGLLADYVQESGAMAIVRGLRALSDFEYEFQISLMNRAVAPEVDTIFLPPSQADVDVKGLSSHLKNKFNLPCRRPREHLS